MTVFSLSYVLRAVANFPVRFFQGILVVQPRWQCATQNAIFFRNVSLSFHLCANFIKSLIIDRKAVYLHKLNSIIDIPFYARIYLLFCELFRRC